MTRGSGSSGSYRDWERERRAQQRAEEQATRLREQQRKARERERAAQEVAAREKEAAAKTRAIERRVAELEGVLQASLPRDPRINIDSLRRRVTVPPLDLGLLGVPLPPPEWVDFEPEPPRGIRRMLGGQQRYEAAIDMAQEAFRQAEEDHQRREVERRRQVGNAI